MFLFPPSSRCASYFALPALPIFQSPKPSAQGVVATAENESVGRAAETAAAALERPVRIGKPRGFAAGAQRGLLHPPSGLPLGSTLVRLAVESERLNEAVGGVIQLAERTEAHPAVQVYDNKSTPQPWRTPNSVPAWTAGGAK